MFRWAEKRKPWRQLLIEGNPAELVDVKQVVQADYDLSNECDRVLSREEIVLLRDRLVSLRKAYETAADRRKATRPVSPVTELTLWIMLPAHANCSQIVPTALGAKKKDLALVKLSP